MHRRICQEFCVNSSNLILTDFKMRILVLPLSLSYHLEADHIHVLATSCSS